MKIQLGEQGARLASAAGYVAGLLWTMTPMVALGWLVGAIARHPKADAELSTEPAYLFLTSWQGGIGILPTVVLLILAMLGLRGIAFVAAETGYSERGDTGLAGKVLVFLLRPLLSALAFCFSASMYRGTARSMEGSIVLLVCYAIFAVFVHYAANHDAPDESKESARLPA
jgi:hypothetical protein